jgi:putative N6-adenine-specific DNA methylase
MGDIEDVHELYKDLGAKLKEHETWSTYIITSEEQFEANFGKRADKKRKLYNGRIKVDYYQFFGPRPPRKED